MDQLHKLEFILLLLTTPNHGFYDMLFFTLVESNLLFMPCLIVFLIMDDMFWCSEQALFWMLCELVFAHL
jgi:hypothetical protein